MPGPDPIRMLADLVVPRAVDAIDMNDVIAEIDLNEVLEQVDLDALVDRIDVNALVARVDIESVLSRVDLEAVIQRIDIDRVLNTVDLDALIDRIDVNALVARVDIERVVDRVDVDALVQHVDVDSVMERIDIAGIVRRVQVDAIVTATAGNLGHRILELVRRQLVGLDAIFTRVVDRLFRRRVDEPIADDGTFTGQVAGGASRLAAFLLDWGIVSVTFSLALSLGFFLASLFVGHNIKPETGGGLWHIFAYVGVALLYQWISLVIAGRTFGRAAAGLRVTAPDRSPLTMAAATRRVLVYPFSFILGLGLIGIVTGRRHRALHDIAAPSLVFYDWGDRPAEMPAPLTKFLERQKIGPDGQHSNGQTSGAQVPARLLSPQG